ncbi:Tetratricopeptide repeat (TPR)-like superfamily protein [Abeliophyllum distichum]|uniref:Tetratricopeptide repeat (TPR)-like superfamily protein n=1 Tax=Abeliophyllum distichum TaxID=126358 RepID=A0ABD1QUS9_9LAMI
MLHAPCTVHLLINQHSKDEVVQDQNSKELMLTLRHKPDKSSSFIDRCEFADDGDIDSIRDRAKMSALLLYRLIHKGHTSVMATILDKETVEKQRKKVATALHAAHSAAMQVQQAQEQSSMAKLGKSFARILAKPGTREISPWFRNQRGEEKSTPL